MGVRGEKKKKKYFLRISTTASSGTRNPFRDVESKRGGSNRDSDVETDSDEDSVYEPSEDHDDDEGNHVGTMPYDTKICADERQDELIEVEELEDME